MTRNPNRPPRAAAAASRCSITVKSYTPCDGSTVFQAMASRAYSSIRSGHHAGSFGCASHRYSPRPEFTISGSDSGTGAAANATAI